MSAKSDQTLEAAHAKVLADKSLQFTMQPYEAVEPPKWLRPLGEFLQAIAPYVKYVFWAGVAVVACLILYQAWNFVRQRQNQTGARAKNQTTEPKQIRIDAQRARATLEQADRLAKEGRYSEATRVILHRSIEDIQDVDPASIRPGVTSREITRLSALSESGRDVFSSIARRVEESLFAGLDMTAAGYFASRKEYEGFVFGGIKR